MNKRLTKKAKVVVFCVLAVVFVLIIGTLNTYKRKGVVVESNRLQVTIEDRQGNLWRTEKKGLKVGDSVVITMHDRGTTSIYDDKIIRVEKVGE